MTKTRLKLTGLDDKTKQYALKLLSYKGRSEREMEERLRKRGASHEVIVSTIQYLRNAGLLNDLSLAESLKREALTNRMLSQNGARNFILRRGIPKTIVDSLFRSDENTDFENALRFADKKLRLLEKYPALTAKRRLYHLLLRRGYSVGTIMKVINDKHMKEEHQ
jgi:regulatory protein